MTALIFLSIGAAMVVAVRGRRGLAVGLFAVSFVLAALWLNHHIVDILNLSL